ncbi:MAG: alpha/beta hydrolase [Xanthomonadales bacterium]|nr:alpha/beta hydrolase [Xanthomonadales bacterium]
MNYSEHRYRSHDGLSLYYRDYGQSDDVVLCLPGLTRNSRDFQHIASTLAADPVRPWRVISPDLRGRGQSEHDPRPHRYHPGSYAKDIWTLVDQLGVGRFAVIGTSLGGLVAMIMAEQQAGRLRGVVLNDVGPEMPPAVVRILEYAGRTPAVGSWDEAAAQARQLYGLAFPQVPDEFWAAYARLSYHENEHGEIEPQIDRALGEALRRAHRAHGHLQRLRRWGLLRRIHGVPIDLWDAYAAMTMPTLLIRGAHSDILTADITARMQARKPDLQLVTVPERGHSPLLDEAEAAGAIVDFLRQLG